MSRRRLAGATAATVLVVVVGLAAAGVGGLHRDDPSGDSATGQESARSTGVGNPVTNGDGSEVIRQPEEAGTQGLPGLSRTSTTVKDALVTRPLPKTASRRGGLVAGFPKSVIPVLPGSALRSSGVSSTSKALQISIVATSTSSTTAVMGYYRGILSQHGFVESSAPAAAPATAASFRRGADSVVVTVTRSSKKVTSYSLFGTLRAGSSK